MIKPASSAAHEILDHAVPEVALQLAEPDETRSALG